MEESVQHEMKIEILYLAASRKTVFSSFYRLASAGQLWRKQISSRLVSD